MTTQIQKGLQVLQSKGLLRFIRTVSRYIYGNYLTQLPLLDSPTYNGVTVRISHFPWEDSSEPQYESALVDGLEKHVRTGDTVVIVGGGYGVTAVRAAKKVSKQGKVIVFEGSRTHVRKTRETARLNSVGDIIEVNHRIVGPAKAVYGDDNEENIQRIQPYELPECDVLELDCEGAEIEILRNLPQKPREILVETHGVYDAPTDQVCSILGNMSYEIRSENIAEKNKEEFCVENDIRVLVASRS